MGVQPPTAKFSTAENEFFVMPIVLDPSHMDQRAYALYLSILHHGFASLSKRGIPSAKETVIATATFFQEYLSKPS